MAGQIYQRYSKNSVQPSQQHPVYQARRVNDEDKLGHIEEEKEQHGSYFDKEEEEYVPPVQPEFTPTEPEEPQNSVLSAKVKSAIFWVCFIAVMDIELCLCSAIIIPVLSSKLNLDDVYTLKSGSYWVVHVNLTEKDKYIRAAMIRK